MQGRNLYQQQLDTLPHRYVQFDMVLAWTVGAAGGEMVIEGVLKNVRYEFMEDVEVWVYVLDAAGSMVARSMCFVLPHQLRNGDVAPFTVKLPMLLPPDSPLRFTYRYRGCDGGDGGSNWSQTFDWTGPSGT